MASRYPHGLKSETLYETHHVLKSDITQRPLC